MNTAPGHSIKPAGLVLLLAFLFPGNAPCNTSGAAISLLKHCADCRLAEKHVHVAVSDTAFSSTNDCSDCHSKLSDHGHPADIVPLIAVPGVLPLDKDGRLTCNTCHDLRGNSAGLLRTRARGIDFCELCHNNEYFSAMKDQGLSLFTAVHADRTYSSAEDTTTFEDLMMDSSSIRCLGCHEEDNTSYYSGSVIDSGLHTLKSGGNHAIGISYASLQSYGGYRLANLLPESIVLPGGRLACISCHKGFSKDHGKLVVDNSRSSLCYSCHML